MRIWDSGSEPAALRGSRWLGMQRAGTRPAPAFGSCCTSGTPRPCAFQQRAGGRKPTAGLTGLRSMSVVASGKPPRGTTLLPVPETWAPLPIPHWLAGSSEAPAFPVPSAKAGHRRLCLWPQGSAWPSRVPLTSPALPLPRLGAGRQWRGEVRTGHTEAPALIHLKPEAADGTRPYIHNVFSCTDTPMVNFHL